MSCPFLKEGRARYCHAAAVRKLILDGPGSAGGGRCVSETYRLCPLAEKEDEVRSRCPHLEEIQVQYCGAAPVPKLVPFSDSQLSRCMGDGFRYCDSYLALSSPHRAVDPPSTLLYAPNHLWLDVGETGRCHIGVDAFLAEAAGKIDGVTFATTSGTHRPTLALTVNGVEWPLVFPNPMLISGVNGHLRSAAAPVTFDPYGAGWLVEGWELPGRTRAGLVGGRKRRRGSPGSANAWRTTSTRAWFPAATAATRRPGARLLPKQDVIRLFQRFFSKTDWVAEE